MAYHGYEKADRRDKQIIALMQDWIRLPRSATTTFA